MDMTEPLTSSNGVNAVVTETTLDVSVRPIPVIHTQIPAGDPSLGARHTARKRIVYRQVAGGVHVGMLSTHRMTVLDYLSWYSSRSAPQPGRLLSGKILFDAEVESRGS